MLQNIWRDLRLTFESCVTFEKEDPKENIVKSLKAQTFAEDLHAFIRTPRQLEKYFLTWSCFALYFSFKFLVFTPFNLVRVFFSLVLGNRGYKSKYSSWSSIVMVICLLIFSSDLKIFDMSFMYHSFRGQSSLKFYGLLFAFEISQKLLTIIGKRVYSALDSQMQSCKSIFQCWREAICSFTYTMVHTMSMFLQYTVFIVILNSAMGSFTIYFFVMNLTKMKSTAFKKFDNNSYSGQINYDMKDRTNKILYVILFVCSQSIRRVDLFSLKVFFLINVGTLIQWSKHLTILNLSEKNPGIDRTRQQLISTVGDDKKIGPMNCLNMDYTLLPNMIFTLKMVMVIMDPRNTSYNITNLMWDIGTVVACLALFPTLYFICKATKVFVLSP